MERDYLKTVIKEKTLKGEMAKEEFDLMKKDIADD
jgi:hypothetical protein